MIDLLFWSASVGMLGDESWPPAFHFQDFLKIIDMQEPHSAQQQTPAVKEEEGEKEAKVKEDVVVEEETDSSSSSPTSANDPTIHSEL